MISLAVWFAASLAAVTTQAWGRQGVGVAGPPTPEALHLLSGRSLVISSPVRIQRVSVADPAVMDALVVSPQQVLLNGKVAGVSSLVIWDDKDQSRAFEVFVEMDVTALAEKLRQVLPAEPIRIEARGGVVTLSGKVSSQAVADRALAVAQASVLKKESVVSLLEVPTPPATGEVLLEVKFADVDRSTMSQLGVNLLSTSPAKNVFTTQTGEFSPTTLQPNSTITTGASANVPFALSDLLNIFIFRPDINLGAVIRALEQKNLLQILAEPNVLAETGKEASFLAGGQFPFPVVQGSTGGVPVVTIQFHEYGVKLRFTPVITPDGLIHLKVAPEVSSLDYTNALTIQGFTIPSIASRRVESEMILNDGQSFMVAGLVNNQVTEQFSKIPGIGNVPVLGNFFKSRSITKSQDELLVVVTPHVLQAGAPPKPPAMPNFPSTFMPPLSPPPAAPQGHK